VKIVERLKYIGEKPHKIFPHTLLLRKFKTTKSRPVNELDHSLRNTSQLGFFSLGCFPNLVVHPSGKDRTK